MSGLDLKKSTHRKMQNDRKKEVVLAQSGSSNVAVKNAPNTKCCASSSNTMAQNIGGDSSDIAVVKSKVNVNHCNQEVRDGFSTEGNPVKDCIMDEGTKFGLCSRYECCSGTLRLLWVPSWFLVSPGFSRCLVPCVCSPVGFAPNLKIPGIYREFSTATACAGTCPFLP